MSHRNTPSKSVYGSQFTDQETDQIDPNSYSTNIERRQREDINQIFPANLIVMRHSERVDELFPEWTHRCGSKYVPYDANMPLYLPVKRPVHDYLNDTPITVTGQVLARLAGRGIASQGIVPDVIYCSPAIRCIQTANAVRLATGSEALLRIEPGLFENTSLYPDVPPCFATFPQLQSFPIDTNYRPLYTTTRLFTTTESIPDYNNRLYATLRMISLTTETFDEGKKLNVLVVAHASTVDMAVGLLRDGRKQRHTSAQELKGIGLKVPFCSTVLLERREGQRGWFPNPYRLLPVSYRDLSNAYNPEFVNRA